MWYTYLTIKFFCFPPSQWFNKNICCGFNWILNTYWMYQRIPALPFLCILQYVLPTFFFHGHHWLKLANRKHQLFSKYFYCKSLYLIWYNSGFFWHIKTIQEHSDILVFDSGGLLDEGGWPGHILQGVTLDNQFILLVRWVGYCDTRCHLNPPDVFLSEEVTDLNNAVALGSDTVDREMGVYSAHFVLESSGDSWK